MINRKYTLCDPDALRQLCVKYDWFSEGTNTQYEKFFYANEMGCPVEEMITMIWLCSDQDRWCRRDIRFTLIDEGLIPNYRVDVISEGSFTDEGCLVQTFTVRLSGDMYNDFLCKIRPINDRECYETEEQYKAYLDQVEHNKEVFEANLKRSLGITGHMVYERVISEIFTVVHMEKLTD